MADDNFIMEYVIEREKNKVLNRQPLLSIYYERGLFPPPPHTILRDFFKIYSLVDAGSNGPFETHRCHPTRVVGDSRDGWVRNGPRPALPSVHININKKKGGSFDRWSLVIELK